MEVAAYIVELRRIGELLAAAAGRDELDRAIPPCPGWQMRDLLQHIGMVHRSAAANVARGSAKPMTDASSGRRSGRPVRLKSALAMWHLREQG